MKISELPENMKVYFIYMSNHKSFTVMGDEVEKILTSKNQFFQIKTGDIINKSFIVNIVLNHEDTRDYFLEHKDNKLVDKL